MTFLLEARMTIGRHVAGIEEQVKGYVPRILSKEGVVQEELDWLGSSFGRKVLAAQGKILKDSRVTEHPRLTIIGNAGAGKSYVLLNAYLRLARSFLTESDKPVPFFLDLATRLPTSRDIELALDTCYAGLFTRLLSDCQTGCILFLDALDQILINENNPWYFITDLKIFLRKHQQQLKCVVLACRRALYEPNWFADVEPSFSAFHADHLDFGDYAHLIPDRAQREQFFNCAEALGIRELLRSPFIGFDLARSYQAGVPLPSSRTEWYVQQIGKHLRGSQQDQQRGEAPPLEELLTLARQMACLASFGFTSRWTVQEAVD